MAHRTSDRRLIEITHPKTGKVIPVRTPAGTIPVVALVRAFKKGRTVLPDGSVRFSSKPVQALLEPYSEELKQAAEIQRKQYEVNWRHWEEQGLSDNKWIQFRRVFRKLSDAFMLARSASS